MSLVPFAMLCDKCGSRSKEYTPWPCCKDCRDDVCPKCDVPSERSEDEASKTLCRACNVARWRENQAQAIAEVEADRAEQLERILDARCPGSRQGVTEGATILAAGIATRLAGSVSSVSENATDERKSS